MPDYMCKHCKFNHNGWCVARKINGLKNVNRCIDFESGKYGDFDNTPVAKRSKKLSDYNNDELIQELSRRLS